MKSEKEKGLERKKEREREIELQKEQEKEKAKEKGNMKSWIMQYAQEVIINNQCIVIN